MAEPSSTGMSSYRSRIPGGETGATVGETGAMGGEIGGATGGGTDIRDGEQRGENGGEGSGGDGIRAPQSAQSVPSSQLAYSDLGPPSSHAISKSNSHVFLHTPTTPAAPSTLNSRARIFLAPKRLAISLF